MVLLIIFFNIFIQENDKLEDQNLQNINNEEEKNNENIDKPIEKEEDGEKNNEKNKELLNDNDLNPLGDT